MATKRKQQKPENEMLPVGDEMAVADADDKSKKENVHAGHRARMKEQVRKIGLDSFNSHQVLEILLFYSIPQRDTNQIAHELMKKFGTLSNVLNANYNDLMEVNGVSENTATYLTLLPQLCRLYMLSQNETKKKFESYEEIGTYLTGYYVGVQVEMPLLLLLNNKAELVTDPIVLHVGAQNEATFDLRTILEHVIQFKADAVILAHNHPSGDATPSEQDLRITKELRKGFSLLKIRLIDHYIVGKNGFSASRDWNIH